jgi:hypothetical protein
MAKRRRKAEPKGRGPGGSEQFTVQDLGQVTLAVFEACEGLGMTVVEASLEGFLIADADGHRAKISMLGLLGLVRGKQYELWPAAVERYLNATGPAALARAEEVLMAGLRANKDRILPCLKSAAVAEQAPEFWSRSLCRSEAQQEALSHLLNFDLPPAEALRHVRKAVQDPSGRQSLLNLMLVIDLPQTMGLVSLDMVSESARPAEEWLQVAKRNLLARTPDEWFVVEEETGVCCTCVNDSYDAPRVLLFDELLPGKADRGWFVAPMTREDAYFAPATPETAGRPVLRMKELAESKFTRSENPLCKEVFWVYQGKWHHFQFIEVHGYPSILPPEEFQRVFGLGAPAGEEVLPPAKRVFRCPKCDKRVSAAAELAGKKVKCPGCGVAMRIPS